MTLFLTHLSDVFVFNLAKNKTKHSSENDLKGLPDSVPISLKKIKALQKHSKFDL